jgi:hypothetical protein
MSRIVVQNGSLIEFDSQKYFDIVKGNTQENNFNLVFSKPLSFNNSDIVSRENKSVNRQRDTSNAASPNLFNQKKFLNEFHIESDFGRKSVSSLNSG